ncbi:DUF4430 domain-containing protein [Ammoniphilus sp. YIM 78166]|uniref:DUF4430 domain-containing protein n=1 Tax=Ammoniphilus sp. YIM 78166 TaxID=1644106 RepID=UPI0014302646|nr:DUF4430 domain-containing protein [Ammoniphilus sp. YIM 78166]
MKTFWILFLVTGLLLSACTGNQAERPTETPSEHQSHEHAITIVLSKENKQEVMEEKHVEITEGQTVLDVMKAHYQVTTAYNDAFITGINGIEGNEKDKTAWFYSVNGMEATVGANEYKLQPDDLLQFDFRKWE